MGKQSPSFTKLGPEEAQSRLNQINQAQELGKIKESMKSSIGLKSGAREEPTGGVPLEDLLAAGKDNNEIYNEVCEELKHFVEEVNIFALAPERKAIYFPNDKIIHFLRILKKAKMELESRIVMDLFRARVKELNGGKIPTVSERQGIFGKTVNRPMRAEEIASKYTIEDDLPASEANAPGKGGTKMGLMRQLSNRLLKNEEVLDPVKTAPRKLIGLFLEAAGLINIEKADQAQKYFIACLYTPDKLRPSSRTDKERLVKFLMILKRGRKWLDEQIKNIQSVPSGEVSSDEANSQNRKSPAGHVSTPNRQRVGTS